MRQRLQRASAEALPRIDFPCHGCVGDLPSYGFARGATVRPDCPGPTRGRKDVNSTPLWRRPLSSRRQPQMPRTMAQGRRRTVRSCPELACSRGPAQRFLCSKRAPTTPARRALCAQAWFQHLFPCRSTITPAKRPPGRISARTFPRPSRALRKGCRACRGPFCQRLFFYFLLFFFFFGVPSVPRLPLTMLLAGPVPLSHRPHMPASTRSFSSPLSQVPYSHTWTGRVWSSSFPHPHPVCREPCPASIA